MDIELLDGFLLGNYEVEPALGVVERPDGAQYVPPDVMEILVYLAGRPRVVVSASVLRNHIWGETDVPEGKLEQRIADLRAALNDQDKRPAYIQILPEGVRLIAKVRPLGSDKGELRYGGFFNELRRREVIRVSIAYWALAWAILQSADFIFGLVPEIPVWALKFLIILAIIGFPVAIAYSWIYRWTPTGLVVDRPGGPEPAQASQKRINYVIVGAAVIAITLFLAGAPPSPPTTSAVENQTSVAVLRFANIGDAPENTVYSDGISDELLNLLANIDELRVPARESSWSLFGKGLDVPAIAERLNVNYVIEGSVRRNGDRIRVMIQLIDDSGIHIWSKPYDRNRNAILDLPSNIASEVVEELKVVLSLESSDRLRTLPTENEEAYIFYLRAHEYLNRPRQPENLALATELFDKALQADSRFSHAYAGLCDTYLAVFLRGRSQKDVEAAEAACHRASTLNAGLVDVRVALGNLYRHTGQFEKAEDEFRKAIEMQPRLEVAHYGLARSLQGQGRLNETERVLRYCIELEPAYWGPYAALGGFLHNQGRYPEAVQPFERVTELTPDNPDAFTNLGAVHYELGNWDRAAVAYGKSIELGGTVFAYQNLGTLYYFQGRYDLAVSMHEEAVHLAPESYRAWGKLAAATRYVNGKQDVALSAYKRAIELAEADLKVDAGRASTQAYLATYYVNLGNVDAASATIARALQMQPNSPEIHYLSAIVRVRTGDYDGSLSALEEAIDRGYSLRQIMADPQFEALREKRRFKSLLGRKEDQKDQKAR